MSFLRAKSPYAASIVVRIGAFWHLKAAHTCTRAFFMSESKLVPPQGSLLLGVGPLGCNEHVTAVYHGTSLNVKGKSLVLFPLDVVISQQC